MDPLKPGDPGVVGRYRLSARLGQGGMGTVFLGRAPGGDRVTVKLVRPDLASDKTFLERFRKDVATAREVGGTHVAHVLDADADGTPPWMVVEHIAGPSLEAAVATHGPLPEHTLRALGAGLAEGLAAVHEAGLTHRDLKPANVLLAADGPRIADYALARALGSAGMTRTGVVDVPGLPAPEQVTGGSIGSAIDVFALGGVLCHAAGVAPFGEGSVAEIAQKVVREMPDLAELPDWLREIVTDCLKKRPTARPTAAELVARFAAADAADDWLPAELAVLVAEHDEPAAEADADADEDADGTAAAPEVAAAESESDDDEEPETTEVPALAGLVAKQGADDKGDGDADAKADEADEADEADDNATPVATPAVQVTKGKGKGKTKAKAKDDAEADEAPDEAEPDADATTPVPAPAVDTTKAKAKPKAKAKAKTKAAKAEPDEAESDESAEAAPDDDSTPVATPAARVTKGKAKPKEKDEEEDADEDATAVASPVPASPAPAPATPKADKPAAKDPYDGGAPVVVPAIRRGTDAETVKVARDADTPTEVVPPRPAPFEAGAPAAGPGGAPTEFLRPEAAPAAAFPLGAPPAAAGSLPTTHEPREANPVVWYAVIALLGLTAAGLGLFRLTDSAWRDAQNTVMGVVLPGISVVFGLAGLAALALAVLAARGSTDNAPPPSPFDAGRAPEQLPTSADSAR
ncbi:serine/threonine-protein kinase [Embleya sp. NBC_00896]|uniref:serine/threonine-protein kinase n=1 Tax=Embleya sp. NBC_00896 TaxID=2975961 RepID=UPI00386F5741|nr:serine/threonine protein kinase [Embleya sp. NBC_00896]